MTTADALKGMVEWAKQWPTPATILVIAALFWWLAWGTFTNEGFARAEDVNNLEREVSSEVEKLKEDVSDLQDQVKDGRVETLEGYLFEAKLEQCKATGGARQLYAARVARLQATYLDLIGKPFPLPTCDEL